MSEPERYERIERIATGGMGEVWRARDTVLGREVALKVLKQEYADDPTFRARFADEARNAASLHHPGIAAIFDYGVLDGHTPYLVMELVDGRPLSELLGEGRAIDPEQARLLALQVAEGLAVAHQAGVVHRDVKPANLLVTPDGRVKITDFGIARAVGSVPYTQTGQIVGTPHYISPEQARGETATAASDVYALGVVLFECLNGERPFVADSPIATALAHIREEVPALPDTVPPGLAHVVRTALAKDPKDRYPDGGAFADALRDPDGSPVAAPVAAPVTAPVPVPPTDDSTQVLSTPVAAAPVPVTSTTSSTANPSGSSSRRSPWPLIALLALVVVAAIVLLVVHPWTSDPTSGGSSTGTVRVRAAAYVGHPVDEVEAALAAKGLGTTTKTIDNPGGHDAETVAALSPTGRVQKGATITLSVWGQPSSQGQGNGNGQGNDNGNGQGPDKTKGPKPDQSTPPEPSGGSTPAPPSASAGTGEKSTTGGESAAPNGREKPGTGKPSKGPKGD